MIFSSVKISFNNLFFIKICMTDLWSQVCGHSVVILDAYLLLNIHIYHKIKCRLNFISINNKILL